MQLEIPEATENAPCPLCGGTQGLVVGEKGRFGMPVRNLCCETCGTVYISPRATAEAMSEYYRSTYRKHYGGVGYVGADGKSAAPGEPGYEQALLTWHSQQADNALALGRPRAGARVLEVGCRHGKTLSLMKERGQIVPFGIEPGEDEAAEARRRHGCWSRYRTFINRTGYSKRTSFKTCTWSATARDELSDARVNQPGRCG